MTNIRQSIAWWCYAHGEMTADQLLRSAAEIGYSGVDLVPSEHWQAVHDYGLTISAIVGHNSIAEGLNRRENHARIRQEIEHNLRDAQRWKIPILICFSGNRAGLADAEGAEICAEGLRSIAKSAQDVGVTLAIELLNSKVDHGDYQADKTRWGVQVCELVGSPALGLLYDIYHMQIMEGDIIRTIQHYHQYFAHYHTAGNPGRHEINATQEINYPAIMQAIRDTGYTGFVAQEFIPTGDTVAALREAFAICRC